MNKKGQEEMVGFVLIIIIVAVIALVFLVFMIRPDISERESLELSNFLSSSLRYTSDCERYAGKFYDLRGLVEGCFENELCLDERDTCKVMEDIFKGVIEEGYPVGENSETESVRLIIYYEENERKDLIKDLYFGGNCTSGEKGVLDYVYSYPGAIHIEMFRCG